MMPGLCGGTVCKTITSMAELDVNTDVTVDCPDRGTVRTMGRFVYVQLLGTQRILNFAEMQAAIYD
jgi:hypothetical protein